MVRGRYGWLLSLAVWCTVGTAGAVQGGSPTDANSCYADCGDNIHVGQNCACDPDCEKFGDCCLDKNEWCAPVAAKPICSLVDETKANSQVCGTDLGVTFVHSGKIEIMFGDTWHYADPSAPECSDPGLTGWPNGTVSDDSQARFTGGVARPGWVPTSAASATPAGGNGSCKVLAGATPLDFDRQTTTAPDYDFKPIQLFDAFNTNLSLGLGDTPLAAFSDGTNPIALFGRGLPPFRTVFVAKRDGATRTVYHTLADLSIFTKFENPTAARITSMTDFSTPTGGVAGSYALIWGRPRFNTTDGDAPTANPLYLMRQSTPVGGITSWAPGFWGGTNPATGEPIWNPTEAGAIPVIGSDFKNTNQLDIKWIPEIKKWVMLYGGDLTDGANPPTVMDQPRHGAIHMRTADYPWGPWSRPTPLLWREVMGKYYQCDAYNDTNPVGCDRKTFPPPTYPTSDWEPGSTLFTEGTCNSVHPHKVATPNFVSPAFPILCLGFSQRGNLYGPQILTTWTRSLPLDANGLTTTTLYFAVSTWYPYDVVLAAADLRLPSNVYPLKMQLRHSTGRMINASSPPGTTTIAGGTGGGAVAFSVGAASGTTGGQVKLGDTVVFRNVSNGNKLLSRNGSGAVVYVAATATPTNAEKWIIKSIDPAMPIGTIIAPGSTQFRLSPVNASTQFLRSSPALTISASTTDSLWSFTYGCRAGDTCTTHP